MLLLVALVIFTVGVGLGNSSFEADKRSAPVEPATLTPTAGLQALAQVIKTSTPATSATSTSPPTPSATATEVPAETPLPTLTTGVVETVETVAPAVTPAATALPTETLTPEPLPTPTDNYSWTLKVPILMYHYISEPPADADQYRLDLSVSPENFRAQMQYLVDNGFTTIDLYDLSLAIVNKRELPPKPIVITFDDGYLDNYQNAYPVLRELGLSATFFIATGFVDRNSPSHMSWSMIEEIAAGGMRAEPHSKSHIDLTEQDRDGIIYEILGSSETLEAHIGYRPRYFAYPSGRFDAEVIQVMGELEFWGGVTTAGGSWHGYTDRYEWTRLRVRNRTTLAEFVDLVVYEG